MSGGRSALRRLCRGAAALLVVAWACTSDGTGPDTTSVVVAPPEATVASGQTLQLSAQLLDGDGNPMPTSNVIWSTSDSHIADVSGSGVVTAKAAGGPVTITASVGTQTGRMTVTVTSGTPSQLTIETQPSAIGISGAALARQPVVQLRDAAGNATAAAGVLVTAVFTQGVGTLANATATTNAAGRAAFTGLTISGSAGVYRLAFGAQGLTAATSDPITLSAVASLELTVQPPSTAQSGLPFATQPRVLALDAAGNPAVGESVTATVSGAGTLIGAVTATSGASGVAVFADLGLRGTVGSYTLSFTAGTFTIVSDAVALQPGVPATITMVTQPSTSAQSGAVLAQQPSVEVRDDATNPVVGVNVVASIASGGGTLGGATTVATNAAGRATFTNLSITGAPGVRTLGFQAGSATVTSGSIAVSSGAPALMSILTQPSSAAESGVPFLTQPVVEVTDEAGTPAAGFNVTVSVAPGSGSLGGTTTVLTNGSGVATFTDLSIAGLVGDYTLTFSAGSVSITSGTIVLDVGPAAMVVVITQPSPTVQSGVVLPQQPVVEVRDGGNNLVDGVGVTASIASGGGTLGGATTVMTDATGRAAFTNLSITGILGVRTLRFQAGSASVLSDPIDVTAGAPAVLTIVTQPSSTAQSSVAFAQQPIVDVRDSGGNPSAGFVVTATIDSGGGTLGGTTTATIGTDGRATFINLSITGSVGDRTLRFTAQAATAASNAITLSAGPVAALVITLQPSSAADNAVPFPQQPRVRAQDSAGNPIGGLDIAAAIQSGGGTVSGTTTVSTAAGTGVATFTDLTITGLVGPRTLRFSTAGVEVTSNVIDIEPGAPTSVVIVTQPPGIAVSGVTFSRSPVVDVRDVSGNGVPGESVQASIDSGGGTLGGTKLVTTNSSGRATFTSLSITGTPGARTLQFASGALESTSSTVHVALAQGTYLNVQYCGSGSQQQMDVSIPSNALVRPLPVAAFIHGGGWVSGDKSTGLLLDEVRTELLSRGYIVVSLNYRLATTTTNKWPAQINDVKCAVRHLRAEAGDYGFDGVRVGVWGVSAGGHLASMLGVTDAASGFEGNGGFASESSRVTAVATVGGISDLTAGFPNPELDFSGPEKTFSSYPGPSTELDEASPIWWETFDDPPFLLVHGDQDDTVFPAQAQRLFDQLDAVGANATLQYVANGGHNLEDVGVGTPTPTIAQVALQIADFFDVHVFGDP